MTSTLRVLSLSTLYPNNSTPNFGIFVECQMRAVVERSDIELAQINPVGLPPFPISLHPRYQELRYVLGAEVRHGVSVVRPRFRLVPRLSVPFNSVSLTHAVLPLARRLHSLHPFDLVDAQVFYPDGPAAVRIGRSLGLPVCIKGRGADIHRWGTSYGTASQVIEAGRDAAGVLAVSQGIAEDMAALGIPREKIHVHHTGLDRSLFYPRDKREARNRLMLPLMRPVLVSVGSLIPRKGQIFAIDALTRLPDAILLLVGTGNNETMLRNHVARLGLRDRVYFLGSVPHHEIPWILSAGDVFVLPTSSEGLANAWVEALACGLPVVTSPIPGAQELLTTSNLARLVDRDPDLIAAAVKDLLSSNFRPADFDQCVASYSWEHNAQELIQHWRKIASRC